eukprot:scaffold2764_cov399-Prasinococcus_capsulatus_cf.AAC.6
MQPVGIQGTNGFAQVSEGLPICQVEVRARVILHHPWEHGILCQVIEAPIGFAIQVHQVIEVAYPTPPPIFRPLIPAFHLPQAHGWLGPKLAIKQVAGVFVLEGEVHAVP